MCERRKILVLGGTRLARRAAASLRDRGHEVIYSLAGITSTPRLPSGVRLHRGGFGGAPGLAEWLMRENVDILVDATHPFAATMQDNAAHAAQMARVLRLRLAHPPWRPGRGDRWIAAGSIAHAATMMPQGARAFAALGSKGLAGLLIRPDLHLKARVMTPPQFLLPPRWRIIREGPRGAVARELALLRAIRAQWLICRNSGAPSGLPLLRAARALRLPVLMVARPQNEDDGLTRNLEGLARAVQKPARLSPSGSFWCSSPPACASAGRRRHGRNRSAPAVAAGWHGPG